MAIPAALFLCLRGAADTEAYKAKVENNVELNFMLAVIEY
jgi:hypothetical protein